MSNADRLRGEIVRLEAELGITVDFVLRRRADPFRYSDLTDDETLLLVEWYALEAEDIGSKRHGPPGTPNPLLYPTPRE